MPDCLNANVLKYNRFPLRRLLKSDKIYYDTYSAYSCNSAILEMTAGYAEAFPLSCLQKAGAFQAV